MHGLLVALRVIVLANLLGGISALVATFASAQPDLSPQAEATFLFGLFEVNPAHAAMHLLLGVAGLACWYSVPNARVYLWAHTVWFAGLAIVGLVHAATLSPAGSLLGMAINGPDHVAHLVLAGASLLALLYRQPRLF